MGGRGEHSRLRTACTKGLRSQGVVHAKKGEGSVVGGKEWGNILSLRNFINRKIIPSLQSCCEN